MEQAPTPINQANQGQTAGSSRAELRTELRQSYDALTGPAAPTPYMVGTALAAADRADRYGASGAGQDEFGAYTRLITETVEGQTLTLSARAEARVLAITRANSAQNLSRTEKKNYSSFYNKTNIDRHLSPTQVFVAFKRQAADRISLNHAIIQARAVAAHQDPIDRRTHKQVMADVLCDQTADLMRDFSPSAASPATLGDHFSEAAAFSPPPTAAPIAATDRRHPASHTLEPSPAINRHHKLGRLIAVVAGLAGQVKTELRSTRPFMSQDTIESDTRAYYSRSNRLIRRATAGLVLAGLATSAVFIVSESHPNRYDPAVASQPTAASSAGYAPSSSSSPTSKPSVPSSNRQSNTGTHPTPHAPRRAAPDKLVRTGAKPNNQRIVAHKLQHRGDTIWGTATNLYRHHGYNREYSSIPQLKDKILDISHISEYQARHMAVGQHFDIPRLAA